MVPQVYSESGILKSLYASQCIVQIKYKKGGHKIFCSQVMLMFAGKKIQHTSHILADGQSFSKRLHTHAARSISPSVVDIISSGTASEQVIF